MISCDFPMILLPMPLTRAKTRCWLDKAPRWWRGGQAGRWLSGAGTAANGASHALPLPSPHGNCSTAPCRAPGRLAWTTARHANCAHCTPRAPPSPRTHARAHCAAWRIPDGHPARANHAVPHAFARTDNIATRASAGCPTDHPICETSRWHLSFRDGMPTAPTQIHKPKPRCATKA